MAFLLALYKKPADAAAFDAHYFSRHIPLAKKIPGLSTYEVSTGPVATPQGDAKPCWIAANDSKLSTVIRWYGDPPCGVATGPVLTS